MENKRLKKIFKSSHITDEFQQLGFRNFTLEGRPNQVKDAFQTASDYYRSFERIQRSRNNSIALLGQPGSGKTHLLMAIANNLLKNGHAVHYFPWVEGFNELKDNFDELDSKIKRLQTVQVLFVDDMFKGRQKATEFQLEQSFAVVNYRYLNHLPMLISSERDFDEICGFDMALGSRMFEMCKGFTVLLKGNDDLNYRLL